MWLLDVIGGRLGVLARHPARLQAAPVGKVCSAREAAFSAALYPGFAGGM